MTFRALDAMRNRKISSLLSLRIVLMMSIQSINNFIAGIFIISDLTGDTVDDPVRSLKAESAVNEVVLHVYYYQKSAHTMPP